MNHKRFNKYTNAAIKAARIGGGILSEYFNGKITVGYKGRIDPVTVADRLSQDAVIKYLRKKFPEHSIIGEEDRRSLSCSEFCWIVDPLDGTVNFIHGIELFCVSIGLMHKGKVVSGVIYAPCLNELFVAQKGAGVYLNDRRLKTSSVNKLVRSLAVTGFPYDINSEGVQILESLSRVIVHVQGIRRLGSAALDLAYVAAGRFDAFWEKGLQPWDVAAGSLMVQEAGGKVTDYNGLNNYIFGKTLLATNGFVHKPMQSLINGE